MYLRKHRTVEIYFVLYLAAIIFLLPDKAPDSDIELHGTPVLQGPFSLQPVKTSLACRFYIDSAGAHILSIDSINTIIFSGDVEDVNFRFEVEDLSIRQKQIITGASEYFRFEEDMSKQELKFYWKPPLIEGENKTYVINVIATAREKIGIDDDSHKKEIYTDETQFSLIMTDVSKEIENNLYEQQYMASNEQNLGDEFANYDISRFWQLRDGEIKIEPKDNPVKALAYQDWSNEIYVFGAFPSTELSGKPRIKTFLDPPGNNGTAGLAEIGESSIIISGKTPSHGKMKVEVSLKFSFDNKERKEEFWVSPIIIKRPKYESIMYPEKLYVIYPNLPYVPGWETQVFIKDKDKVLKKSAQGEPLTFRPEITHIRKVLTLERFINDSLYDHYDIRVLDYPEPVIYNMRVDNLNEIIIYTRSFGFFNGKKNNVGLEVSGNAKLRELFGQILKSPDEITILQRFKCTPKDKEKPFIFEVKAVDKRGRESQLKKYSAPE